MKEESVSLLRRGQAWFMVPMKRTETPNTVVAAR